MPSPVAQIELPELDLTDIDLKAAWEERCKADEQNPERKYLLLAIEAEAANKYCRERQLLEAINQLSALREASELLERAADLLDEVPVRDDPNFWSDYYLYSGDHMICTDEGWEPGESKQSYLDDWAKDGASNPILCEVNAPLPPQPANAGKDK